MEQAIRQVQTSGFCAASWQPEVVALSAPLRTVDATYVVNVSVSTSEPIETIVARLSDPLLGLVSDIQSSLEVKATQEA